MRRFLLMFDWPNVGRAVLWYLTAAAAAAMAVCVIVWTVTLAFCGLAGME